MPDPKFSKPTADWSRAEHAEYQSLVSNARNDAFAAGNANAVCQASGSLRTVAACAKKNGCAHCAGQIAAAAKQSELTGYDPSKELNA